MLNKSAIRVMHKSETFVHPLLLKIFAGVTNYKRAVQTNHGFQISFITMGEVLLVQLLLVYLQPSKRVGQSFTGFKHFIGFPQILQPSVTLPLLHRFIAVSTARPKSD